MRFLLDSNTYIQAKNTYYDMQFCPAYWDWIDEKVAAGELASIDMVYQEIQARDDALATWVKSRKHQFLPVTDIDCQDKFTEISNYVSGLPNMKDGQAASFLNGADPWLVAKAATLGATIVTLEKAVPMSSQKIKIPNICKKFNVAYIDSFQLLRTLQAQFVLAP